MPQADSSILTSCPLAPLAEEARRWLHVADDPCLSLAASRDCIENLCRVEAMARVLTYYRQLLGAPEAA